MSLTFDRLHCVSQHYGPSGRGYPALRADSDDRILAFANISGAYNGSAGLPDAVEDFGRIALCANFCRDVPDPQLKALEAHGGLRELLVERSQLRSALAKLQANPNDPRAHRVAMDAMNYLNGLPAKVNEKPSPAIVTVTRDDGSPPKTMHLYPGDEAAIKVDSSLAVQQGRRLLAALKPLLRDAADAAAFNRKQGFLDIAAERMARVNAAREAIDEIEGGTT